MICVDSRPRDLLEFVPRQATRLRVGDRRHFLRREDIPIEVEPEPPRFMLELVEPPLDGDSDSGGPQFGVIEDDHAAADALAALALDLRAVARAKQHYLMRVDDRQILG